MKLGAVTMAYRDQETIRGTLACLNPFVDKHYVFINERPFYGKYEEPDSTEAICNEFDKVEVIKGHWLEHQSRNIGIDLCSDCDWMIGFDADEMIEPSHMERLIKLLGEVKEDAVGFRSKVYWHSTDYRFDPYPDHIKVCITRGKARYWEKQCINVPYYVIDRADILHHHLSYCEPKNIYRKVTCYNHANEFDGKKWYEEHFANWKPGMPVYQPFGTEWQAVYDPLPDSLKRLL